MVIRHYAYVVKVIFHKIWLFCQFVVFYILIDVFSWPIWRIYNNNSSFITNRFDTLFLHRLARVYYVSYITCRLILKISKKMNLIRIWINDGYYKKLDVDFKTLYHIFMLEYWISPVKDSEINTKVLLVAVEYESQESSFEILVYYG